MAMDVAATLLVWQRRAGSYGGFNAAHRIPLPDLANRPDDVALLRDIWLDPAARTSDARAARVTREVAEKLARLAAALEKRGHDQEKVARFLIRCVFAMFAEDEGLLPGEPFSAILRDAAQAGPEEVEGALAELWRAMDEGRYFGPRKLLRFNGHFFKDHGTLPLTREDIAVLREAAEADWRSVEPTIFGTLLTRALDPEERHRLGAEYTPRAYVERLVRPTIEEPLRERWLLVEAEVLSAIADLTGQPELVVDEVGPWQFHGIEIKPWAREIAELTLWIGYHQFWREHHGGRTPREPLLQDTGTLELRDAVLAWDEIREDPSRARPDPTPRIPHPVTGKLVPDPNAKLPYYEHVNPRPAEWPRADFIVGNPPYMGRGRQREAFGDGYVDALRAAYPEVPDNADYVMYWWYRAAKEVGEGRTIRAGLITTNTITQRHNREVIEGARENGTDIVWAIADHPWVDETGSAAVRVAMTVMERDPASATLVTVDDDASVVSTVTVERLNSDLTAHADVAGAASEPLLANRGLSSQGFTLVGDGFRLPVEEGQRLISADSSHAEIVRPLVNGRDLTHRPRGFFTIDFGLMTEDEAKRFPVLYDLLRNRVLPTRAANKREAYARYWWRYGETRSGLRDALGGLERYIATVETAKHRIFQFLPISTVAEHSVICLALDDAFHLGVLSSAIHVAWALAAGGTLEDRPRYQKILCFDPFPFPDPPPELRQRIADVAGRLDRHRKEALERDERVTMTGMYNVLEKLRSGEPLTPKEREIHEIAACGVLRDLHDELDRLVAEAYGWEWPLETDEILARLVALHDERVAEERAGRVRWLRPDYQIPRFARDAAQAEAPPAGEDRGARDDAADTRPWPATTVEQIRALLDLVAATPATVDEATATFRGARRDIVERHLETLAIMGEVQRDEAGRYRATAIAPARSH